MDNKSFMEHFAVSLFFIKPIPGKYFPKKSTKKIPPTDSSNSSPPKGIPLHSGHFNLLWLIKKLADELEPMETSHGKKYVTTLTKLRQVFIWYSSIELDNPSDEIKKTIITVLKNMLASLRNTGHLHYIKEGTTYYYYLTDEGINLYKKNRRGRKFQVKNFFRESGLTKKQFKKIIQNSKYITPLLWEKVLADSEKIEIPKDIKS